MAAWPEVRRAIGADRGDRRLMPQMLQHDRSIYAAEIDPSSRLLDAVVLKRILFQ
jgi:hypothetical protein